LSQSNVTSVSERGDAKTFSDSEIFISVSEVDVSDGDDGVALFTLPVDTRVLLPIEVGDSLVRVHAVHVSDFARQITLMDLDGNQSFNLGSLQLVSDVL
jgi:hypothetical protein